MEDSKSERGDSPTKDIHTNSYQKGAREIADLGAITSLIKIDGSPVAKLDVVSSMRGGSLHYKINSMDNITELYSKGFNVTIRYVWHVMTGSLYTGIVKPIIIIIVTISTNGEEDESTSRSLYNC